MPGNIEFFMINGGWNGDFEIDSTGDLVLAQDVTGNPIATQQRVYRLLMTNPRNFNEDTSLPASVPDDLFAPDWGAGLRRTVGSMMTSTLLGDIDAAITSGLQSDPTIVSNPPPSIVVTNAGGGLLQIEVSCTAQNGEVIPIPSFPLSTTGGI